MVIIIGLILATCICVVLGYLLIYIMHNVVGLTLTLVDRVNVLEQNTQPLPNQYRQCKLCFNAAYYPASTGDSTLTCSKCGGVMALLK